MKLTCETAAQCQQIASMMEEVVATAAVVAAIALALLAVGYHGYRWHRHKYDSREHTQR